MLYTPSPLLYSAGPDFCSAFRLAVTLAEPIRPQALARAVEEAMTRYPYFAVMPQVEGDRLVLRGNPSPVPISPQGRTLTLGSPETSGHLLAFAWEGATLYLDCSHFIADGMGILPLLKTLLYCYLTACHGPQGLDSRGIRLPGSPVDPGEYAFPFPDVPLACRIWKGLQDVPQDPYTLDPAAFGPGGLYSYHLRISQKALMKRANTSDASPVSFLSTMLYRALCRLDPELTQPVVGHVQHQYRAALGTPLSHHSLVCYVPIVFTHYLKNMPLYTQNTAIRGQVILRSDEYVDIENVNRLLQHFICVADAPLGEKTRAMEEFVDRSIRGKTFGISYMGRVDWGGMERHIRDFRAYIGERDTKSLLLLEVMTLGEDFLVSLMQSGPGERYLRAFMAQLEANGIPATLYDQGHYRLCDTRLPKK